MLLLYGLVHDFGYMHVHVDVGYISGNCWVIGPVDAQFNGHCQKVLQNGYTNQYFQ